MSGWLEQFIKTTSSATASYALPTIATTLGITNPIALTVLGLAGSTGVPAIIDTFFRRNSNPLNQTMSTPSTQSSNESSTQSSNSIWNSLKPSTGTLLGIGAAGLGSYALNKLLNKSNSGTSNVTSNVNPKIESKINPKIESAINPDFKIDLDNLLNPQNNLAANNQLEHGYEPTSFNNYTPSININNYDGFGNTPQQPIIQIGLTPDLNPHYYGYMGKPQSNVYESIASPDNYMIEWLTEQGF